MLTLLKVCSNTWLSTAILQRFENSFVSWRLGSDWR